MKWFNDLENSRNGRAIIPNLMLYLCVLYVVGWAANLILPGFYYQYLSLNVTAILHGQVWRLVTWLAYPPSSSMLLGLILIYVYWTIGRNLEMAWGSFQFDWFILQAVVLHVIGAFILYAFREDYNVIMAIAPQTMSLTAENFNLSILLAFMASFPEATFLLFFIIPVKAKYLGIFYAVITVLNFIQGGTAMKVEIIISLVNFLLFLWETGRGSNMIYKFKRDRQKSKFKFK